MRELIYDILHECELYVGVAGAVMNLMKDLTVVLPTALCFGATDGVFHM